MIVFSHEKTINLHLYIVAYLALAISLAGLCLVLRLQGFVGGSVRRLNEQARELSPESSAKMMDERSSKVLAAAAVGGRSTTRKPAAPQPVSVKPADVEALPSSTVEPGSAPAADAVV